MKIVEDKLSNGVRVVTAERAESAAVAFHIYFGCGGRHERDEVVGVSHALEHMVFKGTPSRTTLDIAREMEGNGASINANTAPERTCYHFTAPADAFATVLEVYADAVNNCLLDKDEWDRERMVILEELKMYEDMPRVWVSDMLEDHRLQPADGRHRGSRYHQRDRARAHARADREMVHPRKYGHLRGGRREARGGDGALRAAFRGSGRQR